MKPMVKLRPLLLLKRKSPLLLKNLAVAARGGMETLRPALQQMLLKVLYKGIRRVSSRSWRRKKNLKLNQRAMLPRNLLEPLLLLPALRGMVQQPTWSGFFSSTHLKWNRGHDHSSSYDRVIFVAFGGLSSQIISDWARYGTDDFDGVNTKSVTPSDVEGGELDVDTKNSESKSLIRKKLSGTKKYSRDVSTFELY
ncbi:hypothetical protein NC653_035601 [Populus alba x Populus x berolinensis]|uniref:Uncharacterized protein n=1 Tax=Populus alba x Populus x berolinensis TaxID=444605 RepID=A0AAD6LI86_9ROSI|nr:hypothetical protein NC653_035601 [Populus alba x Populus x berolinensis]